MLIKIIYKIKQKYKIQKVIIIKKRLFQLSNFPQSHKNLYHIPTFGGKHNSSNLLIKRGVKEEKGGLKKKKT